MSFNVDESGGQSLSMNTMQSSTSEKAVSGKVRIKREKLSALFAKLNEAETEATKVVNSPPPKPALPYSATAYEIYFVGLSIMVGGQVVGWSRGLNVGFWPFFLTTIVLGLASTCLALCLGELLSMATFSGGSFGLIRCIIGPYVGFIAGVALSVQYVVFIACELIVLGAILIELFGIDSDFHPILWALCFAIVLPIHLYHGGLFWKSTLSIGVLAVISVAFYVLSTSPDASLSRYNAHFHVSDGMHFMQYFPFAAWFFRGMEVITLTSSYLDDPKAIIPTLLPVVVLIAIATSLSILLSVASSYPGPNVTEDSVLTIQNSFSNALDMTQRIGAIIMIPGSLAITSGYIFATGQQLQSMAQCLALPSWLGIGYGAFKSPRIALVCGVTASYVVALIAFYATTSAHDAVDILFNIGLLGSCGVYCCLAMAYLVAQQRFKHLKRSFTLPMGEYVATAALLVFSFVGIAAGFFHQEHFISLAIWVVLILAAAGWYQSAVRTRETFTDEEHGQFVQLHALKVQRKTSLCIPVSLSALSDAVLCTGRRHAEAVYPTTTSTEPSS